MPFILPNPVLLKISSSVLLTLLLVACGGESPDAEPVEQPPIVTLQQPTTKGLLHRISRAFFPTQYPAGTDPDAAFVNPGLKVFFEKGRMADEQGNTYTIGQFDSGNGSEQLTLFSSNAAGDGSQVRLISTDGFTLLSTISWAHNYNSATLYPLPDMNNDGINDLGLFGVRNDIGNEGKPQFFIRSGANGNRIQVINWPANWSDMSLLVLPDLSGDGIAEIGLQGRFKVGDRPQLFIKNGATGTNVDTFTYPNLWDDPQYMVFSDVTGDGIAEIALFGKIRRNGKPQVKITDGTDNNIRLKAYTFPNKWDNVRWVRLSDVNGDGEDDWGLFGINKDDGRPQLIVKDGTDPKGALAIFAWSAGFEFAQFYRIPDMNGDGIDEVAVAGYREDINRYQMTVKSGADRNLVIANYGWPNNWSNVSFPSLGDLNGDGLPEFVLYGQNNSGDYELVIKHGDTSEGELRRQSLGADWLNKPVLVGVSDLDNDDLSDFVLYGHNAIGLGLLQSYSAATGELILDGSSVLSTDADPDPTPTVEITGAPSNQISHAFYRDQDGILGKLAGTVIVEANEIDEMDPSRVESVWVYWADKQGNKVGDVWLKTDSNTVYQINIPEGTLIPENTNALLLYPTNNIGQASQGNLIYFHDFIGNAALSGPGGNEIQAWYYGADRPEIAVQRTSNQGGSCIFDNGLVSVTDMGNTRDDAWDASTGDVSNNVNEGAFPAFEFLCDDNPVNTSDEVSDEYGVWTYSTLNDAMFYGTLVYDTFVQYLGEPPLEDKIRLRVHYGNLNDTSAYWDGAYANFGDAFLQQYSMAPLDAIAHEVGHGVLNRISDLNLFNHKISTDARTLHEAFGDLAGLMAKYQFTGHTNNWIHGEESGGRTRQLDQIKTESGAIDSLLDYDEAGDNFYLRIGMITYPFYLLANQWGIDAAYKVYVDSARTCWAAMTTLTEAAECIKQQAGIAGLSEADVVAAFKTVKIKLFEEGVLSHFNAKTFKLRTEFTDNSRSTSQVTQWLWDFGDGQSSTEASPEHTFAQTGDYQVSLTVTDQSNDQDSFTRLVSVTDQYCAIQSVDVDNHISSVVIGTTDIGYEQTEWDYTQSPIILTNPGNTLIDVVGDTFATERSTSWLIWIDLNDDGVFGDGSYRLSEENQEFLVDTDVAEGQPYALRTALDLSALPNDGKPKHMRIIGRYAAFRPCSAYVGEALDLRVTW
jgi:vibriolysin